VARPPLLIFDVESLGLHGEGYAWGLVLIEGGEIVTEALAWCALDQVLPEPWDLAGGGTWAEENVIPKLIRATTTPTHDHPYRLRTEFWELWAGAKDNLGAILMADVNWPVESNFLSACIADHGDDRGWNGPYPLWDAGTLRAAGLVGPAEDVHQPLEDAKATWVSVRDWWLR
jgi:hypothetical protein